METSKIGTLNVKDLVIGLLIMVFGSLAAGATEAVNTIVVNHLPLIFNWAFFQPILTTAALAGAGWLMTALGLNSKQEIFKKELN